MIKVILFDFDGVIVESVDIKTQAFRNLFKGYPDKLQDIIDYHLANGGMSRSRKIKYFYTNILKKPLSEGKLNSLCNQFKALVVDQVVKAPFVAGAEQLLQDCLNQYNIFIVSGVPEEEVRKIARMRNLEKYFSGIFGSPKTKEEIMRMIMKKQQLNGREIVFIGDSANDLHAAKGVGVPFIARVAHSNTSWAKDSGVVACVYDLTRVGSLLKQINKNEKSWL